jgi:hypothetical protein
MPLYAVLRDTMTGDGTTSVGRTHADAALAFARIDHAGQAPTGYEETLYVRRTAPNPELVARVIRVTNVDGWTIEDRGLG